MPSTEQGTSAAVATNSAKVEAPKPKHYMRNWAAFWVLGMINNFGYCVVLDASDHIAEEFNLKTYIALISWANIFGGLFLKLMNTFILTHTSYNKRFTANTCMAMGGMVVVSIAKYCGTNDVLRFIIALIGITFVGNASAYGESAALGYLEGFHSRLVGAWSSGTGMSGVAAGLMYILLVRAIGMSNTAAFLSLAPLNLVYLSMYFWVIKIPLRPLPATNPGIKSEELATDPAFAQRSALLAGTTDDGEQRYGSNWKHTSWGPLPKSNGGSADKPLGERWKEWKANVWPRVKYIHKLIRFYNVNLALVYIFEYAVQFVFPFVTLCVAQKHSSKFLLENCFILSQFAYQTGVLCSRSSLVCIRIRRVWILSLLQFINAVCWFIQAKTKLLSSHYDGTVADYSGSHAETVDQYWTAFLLCWMFYVGLLGGAAYVNVFYNILELDELYLPPPAESIQEEGAVAANQSSAAVEDDEEAAVAGRRDSSVVKEDRSLAMNIGAIYAVIGITLGSLVDVLFSNTVLTDTCK